MKHEKTFEAIAKLNDIEMELHRLKNALEMANKALDAKRERVGLTDEEINDHRLSLGYDYEDLPDPWDFAQGVRAAERAHGIGKGEA